MDDTDDYVIPNRHIVALYSSLYSRIRLPRILYLGIPKLIFKKHSNKVNWKKEGF